MKKLMIVGGTGFLGYYTALEALKKGYKVSSFALDEIDLSGFYPKEIDVTFGDIYELSEDELVNILKGHDYMVYSVGPDDRITPAAPSYEFFREGLVEQCSKVYRAARRAGIKRTVLFNSYFAYFDRAYPEKKLAEYHPYIRCRVEQQARLMEESEGEMDVITLELPYIFGAMPERTPIWKDVYIERFFRAPAIFFPRGGTSMIHADNVGRAAIGALEHGEHGGRYPVADENLPFKTMIGYMQEGLKLKKPVMQPGKRICAAGANSIAKKEAREGREAGLNMKRLMLDIMGEELYIPAEMIDEISKKFGYYEYRGNVKKGILEAMEACYPNGF